MLQSSLIWGLVPFIFSGFGTADQSHNQAQQLTEIRAGQIERSIKDAIELRCYAQIEGNMVALVFAENSVRKYQADYISLMKHYAPEPPCDAIIVTKR